MNTYLNEAMAEQEFLTGVITRLRRRKLLIVVLTLSLFLAIGLGIEMLPKSYRGAASVAIEGQTPSAVQVGDVVRDSPFDDQTLGTELAILQSRELLSDAIRQTGLLSKPEFNPTLQPSWQGQIVTNLRQSFAAWLPTREDDLVVTTSEQTQADVLDTLRKHLKVTPIPHSRVIEIAVTANNNKLAAQIANSIADLYITNHREYKIAASREAHQFLDARIGELQKDAAAKAAAVEQYRIAHGLTTAMTSTLLQEQVSGLSTQLLAARARLAELEGQADTAKRSNPQQLAEVLASPTIGKLREQEATIAAERARLVATYGHNWPALGRVESQLAGVRVQIAAEAARTVQSLPNAVASVRANVDSLSKRLTDLRAQISQMDEARARLTTLEDDSSSARGVYNEFLTRLRSIDASMAYGATNVRVISHAAPATSPSFPNYMIMLSAGFVLSLGVAGLSAYLTTQPKGIIGTNDIESLYDIPALGMIPFRTARTETLFDTAIEQLLNRLVLLSEQPPRSILITSALPQEGKTTTAHALAEAAMRRGMNVFLVDADMRSARALRPRAPAPTIGLGDVLRGTANLHDVTRNVGGGVQMLPAGSPRGNPTSLMALPTLGRLMERLTMTHDLVIVDAPPALVGGDCEMLARTVDTTVMLAKWHSTPPEAVSVALKQLDAKRLAGMVLTMVDSDKIVQFGQSDAVVFSKRLHQYYQHRA